jgi:hypothetical protein
MPALDQQVGGGHDPAVRRADDRGVIAGPEQRSRLARQQFPDRRDQSELA